MRRCLPNDKIQSLKQWNIVHHVEAETRWIAMLSLWASPCWKCLLRTLSHIAYEVVSYFVVRFRPLRGRDANTQPEWKMRLQPSKRVACACLAQTHQATWARDGNSKTMACTCAKGNSHSPPNTGDLILKFSSSTY